MLKSSKKWNKGLKVVISVLLIVCLVISGFYVYFEFYGKERKVEEVEIPEKEIDDRVSPLTTQAVFLEINRIRRKGIIDVMMNSGSKLLNKLPIKDPFVRSALDSLRPGFGWREKPVFSYVVVLDGYKYKGDTFETWDTDYINYEFFRHVEEEQPTAEIEFKFIEKEKKWRKTIEEEIEGFSVVYDFKTGRWSGDDYFNDSDGYGHYNGSRFELWFTVRQTDYDADGIPWWTEVNVLETDPKVDDSKLDPDGDGVPTSWEWKWGYDPYIWDNHTILDPDNDGLQNVEEWFMAKWLANPFHPDMYIETDYMEKAPFELEIRKTKGFISPIERPRLRLKYDRWEYVFWEESQQMLMERFNEHGITVHIDDGCMGGGGEFLPFREGYGQASGIGSKFYKNNFADDRKGVFRYVITQRGGGWCHPQDFKHYYDTITVPTSQVFFKNYLSFAINQRARRIGRAIEVLHELGHSCGFNLTYHGGVDNTTGGGTVFKNYKSAMNYYYFGLFFDYSDGSHGENDKDDWGNLDLAYFQRPSEEMEGLGFDGSVSPYNR